MLTGAQGCVDLFGVAWGNRSLHLYRGDGKGTLAAGPAMWPTVA
ncbi:hypothetical protein [Streptomyces monomycini]|nr:hypothetical protein [Streptomyces monomycini]